MAVYDPRLVRETAKRLEKRAADAVIVFSIIGFVVGPAVASVIMRPFGEGGLVLGVIAGAVIGVVVGGSVGESRSLALRTQSQTLLWQIHVEALLAQSRDLAESVIVPGDDRAA